MRLSIGHFVHREMTYQSHILDVHQRHWQIDLLGRVLCVFDHHSYLALTDLVDELFHHP